MTKVSKKFLQPHKMKRYANNLWSAFTLMDSKEDIRLLFKDLFTHTEYKMFTKRLQIARMLLNGEHYDFVIEELGVTSRTITVISTMLAEKGNGVRKAHYKLCEMEEKELRQHKEKIATLGNPFRRKTKTPSLLGAVIKAGAVTLDRVITKKNRQRSIKKVLEI